MLLRPPDVASDGLFLFYIRAQNIEQARSEERVQGTGSLPGYGAALMMGIGETCGYLIRVGSLLIVLFPLYLFRMIGAGDIKMAAVLFGAAGVQQGGRILLCGLMAAGAWSVVLLVWRGIARQRLTYLVFYLYRSALGGSVEPYYLEARDGKEASFCLAPCLFLGVIGAELIRYL